VTRSALVTILAIGALWMPDSAWAQIPPAGAMLGTLLEADSPANSGEFSIRGPESEVFRFRYDSATRVERAGSQSTLQQLRPGETIQVESDAIADSPLRYARSIAAGAPPPAPKPAPHPRTQTTSATPIDALFPRGELTLSGVVSYRDDGRFVLHTRNAGDQTILLRRDTRYLSDGGIVANSDLKANMRVFVRAGKDLFGHTEAYQVMWGGFLQPREW
jgi:hypothetical protein